MCIRDRFYCKVLRRSDETFKKKATNYLELLPSCYGPCALGRQIQRSPARAGDLPAFFFAPFWRLSRCKSGGKQKKGGNAAQAKKVNQTSTASGEFAEK